MLEVRIVATFEEEESARGDWEMLKTLIVYRIS